MSHENLMFDEIFNLSSIVEAINMIDEAAKVGSLENDIIFPGDPITYDDINNCVPACVLITPPITAYSKSRLSEIINIHRDNEGFRELIIAQFEEYINSGHLLLIDVIDYISQFEDPRLSLPFTRMVEETEGRFEL